MPAISVIVPVYNTQKFLEKCLESIINQTFKDIEIICINDGSTDNSMSILNDYSEKDSRIKIINQKNAGLSCARNTGINNAKGEYIGFVDSDDWIDLDFFEKLYNAAKNYDADIASAGIKRVRSYKWKYHLKIKEEEVTENTDRKFVLSDVHEKCYVWNKIYRLEKIKQFSLYFEAGIYFEDRCFTCEALSKLKRLVVVPDTYYNYWTNPNSIVKSKSTKKTQDAKYTNEKMMKILKLNNINLEHYAEKIKKIKFLGLTILKIKIFKHKKQYILFNQIRFEI